MIATTSNKKPWPRDALMIVAAPADQALRELMAGPVECHCRDCGLALLADTRSVTFLEDHPDRHGRPINFFCIDCCVRYDVRTIGVLHDFRSTPRGAPCPLN